MNQRRFVFKPLDIIFMAIPFLRLSGYRAVRTLLFVQTNTVFTARVTCVSAVLAVAIHRMWTPCTSFSSCFEESTLNIPNTGLFKCKL
jgi:hypothetical protein